jgi:glc operon protein GlcG
MQINKHGPALVALMVGLFFASEATAQLQETRRLTLEAAVNIMDAAQAEAERNGWNVAIAIVDEGGHLLAFRRMDGTQLGSIEIALDKARTSAYFKRPTKALEDAVAGGRYTLLAVGQMLPLEGGESIEFEGTFLGAVGVSGVTSEQDAIIARAGIGALRP